MHTDHAEQRLAFERSVFCGAGDCVEVARGGSAVVVRDSKNPSVTLEFSAQEWEAFVAGVKIGQFG